MTTTTAAAGARAVSAGFPAARPSLARLSAVELRKTADTRAGRWLLLTVTGIGVLALGYRVWHAAEAPVSFELFFGTALQAVMILLPVLGVLAMTTEWSQRTALTTFTLVPRRGRVLVAKLAAAVLLAVAMVLLVAGVSALAVVVAGAMTGDAVSWGDASRLVPGASVAMSVHVLMGAAFGALLQHTAVALIAYFVVPTIWSSVAPALLGDVAAWFDVYGAFGVLAELGLGDEPVRVLTALAAWVLVPLAAGAARSLRREVG